VVLGQGDKSHEATGIHWYWDMTDANREWTKRWQVARPGKFPTMIHAGNYSSVLHYLKAVAALKSDADGKAVVAKMKEMPTDDPVCTENSNSDIMVMQSAKDRVGMDTSSSLNWARERRVLI